MVPVVILVLVGGPELSQLEQDGRPELGIVDEEQGLEVASREQRPQALPGGTEEELPDSGWLGPRTVDTCLPESGVIEEVGDRMQMESATGSPHRVSRT